MTVMLYMQLKDFSRRKLSVTGHLKRFSVLVSSILILLSTNFSNAWALEFQCQMPNDIRFIRLDIPGEEYLCEVSVTIQATGKRDVKWYARNDSLFCSAKAYELRDKYEQLWNYSCTTWPDTNGVDKLSPAQRAILDQRLKTWISRGKNATPPYTINGVRAVASTPLDNQAGKLALQFFTNKGEFTELIDDKVEDWTVATTINELADQIESEIPVVSALIHAVSDEGSMEVYTNLTNEAGSDCYGTQILSPFGNDGQVTPLNPHLFVCQGYDPDRNAFTEAAPSIDESLLIR